MHLLERSIYNFILGCVALLALPRLLYLVLVRGKYRHSFFQRLGKNFPHIEKQQRKLVWIHAVSVGETKAIAALAKRIQSEPHPPLLLISSVTETGHAEAKRSIPNADYHVYLPFDFSWLVFPLVKRVSPDLVILAETDFWAHFLHASKRCGATIAVVNGKLSERSAKRFRWLPWITERLLHVVDRFCVQSTLYQERFVSIGIPSHKITVTGNLKFDEESPSLSQTEKAKGRHELGIAPTDLVLVVGSTHAPEEKLVLEQLQPVWARIPHLKVLIVPRHPERFDEVASLLSQQRISYKRWSAHNVDPASVILIDTMGKLTHCYQLADLAVVGGSFIRKVGGHNITEPCRYAVPVLFGPYMHAQPELTALVKEYGAGEQVEAHDMGRALLTYLQNPELRSTCGRGGRFLFRDAQGATSRTLDALQKIRFPL